MNNFQTILVAVFLAIFAFAVLIFSGVLKIGNNGGTSNVAAGKVVIWGTLTSDEFSRIFDEMNVANRELQVSYIKKDADSYQQELIEAFARDLGPDLFMITPSMILKNDAFIYKIPFTSYPKKTFADTFIDGASIYTNAESVIAIPFAVDPMVMYYNKDILTNQAVVNTPKYWSDLFELSSSLTKKENDGTIRQSMIALGRYDNVKHSKDIISTLLLQNNNSIVSQTTDGYTSVLSNTQQGSEVSLSEQALTFYTEFSNPNYKAYSWNRSLPNSFDLFTQGKLAFYLGRASELFAIQKNNPNLSFDVKEMLQTPDTNRRTYGSIYALAINKKSQYIPASISVAQLVSSGEYAEPFSQALSLPPVSRALLSKKPDDTYVNTFYTSAIIARSWLDPDENKTNEIFSEMLESILSNKSNLNQALTKASAKLELLLKK